MIGEATIGYALYCEVMHFVLGFVVALSVYWLTSTIFCGLLILKSGQKDAYCIRRCSLLLAVSLSVVAHILQDYTLNWF